MHPHAHPHEEPPPPLARRRHLVSEEPTHERLFLIGFTLLNIAPNDEEDIEVKPQVYVPRGRDPDPCSVIVSHAPARARNFARARPIKGHELVASLMSISTSTGARWSSFASLCAVDRARFHAIARGSAMECGALVDVCLIAAFVAVDEARVGKQLLVRIVSMLTKMCR